MASPRFACARLLTIGSASIVLARADSPHENRQGRIRPPLSPGGGGAGAAYFGETEPAVKGGVGASVPTSRSDLREAMTAIVGNAMISARQIRALVAEEHSRRPRGMPAGSHLQRRRIRLWRPASSRLCKLGSEGSPLSLACAPKAEDQMLGDRRGVAMQWQVGAEHHVGASRASRSLPRHGPTCRRKPEASARKGLADQRNYIPHI